MDIEAQNIQTLNILDAINNEPQSLEFVLPGLLRGTVGSLVGAGGAGKTMLALELAIYVAAGYDIAGINRDKEEATHNNVLYLSAEDPKIILSNRIHNISQYFKEDKQERAEQLTNDINENLTISLLAGCQTDIFDEGWQEWLYSMCEEQKLVIVDTLRRFHTTDENNSGEMAKLLGLLENLCKKTGATVLFLHHISKNAMLNNASSQTASRGSAVLTDNARFQLNLSNMSKEEALELGVDEEQASFYACLNFSKINYSQPLSPIWLQRQKGGILTPANFGLGDEDNLTTDDNDDEVVF